MALFYVPSSKQRKKNNNSRLRGNLFMTARMVTERSSTSPEQANPPHHHHAPSFWVCAILEMGGGEGEREREARSRGMPVNGLSQQVTVRSRGTTRKRSGRTRLRTRHASPPPRAAALAFSRCARRPTTTTTRGHCSGLPEKERREERRVSFILRGRAGEEGPAEPEAPPPLLRPHSPRARLQAAAAPPHSVY